MAPGRSDEIVVSRRSVTVLSPGVSEGAAAGGIEEQTTRRATARRLWAHTMFDLRRAWVFG
jgi:hypothetical protein